MGTGKDLWNEAEALFSNKNWVGAASMFASDAVYVEPAGRHVGREAIQVFLEAGGVAFPDLIGETNIVIEEGDTVVGEWTYRATHSGPFVIADGTEIPATDKTMELNGVTVCQIADGKFATAADYFDTAAMMTQLGLMPSP